jgi:hypothetical protein
MTEPTAHPKVICGARERNDKGELQECVRAPRRTTVSPAPRLRRTGHYSRPSSCGLS